MNVCSLLGIPFVTRPASEPYRSTALTLVLKIPILFYMLSAVDLQTDFRLVEACLPVFPILVLTSSSVPPSVLETMLPGWVKETTSLRFLPFMVIDASCWLAIFITSVFSMFT
ncbi:unnamed protein product [Heterobilharzia americana]|nr:unnamed protein product [Heterobilharzia americana]